MEFILNINLKETRSIKYLCDILLYEILRYRMHSN